MSLRHRVLLSLLASGLLVPAARAQSLNLDFGPSSSPVGTAPASYGGVAGSPGVWNAIHAVPTTNLVSVTGAPTGVSVTTDSNSFMYFVSGDFSTPPDEALIDDHMAADLGGYEVIVSGLASGEYVVYAICVEYVNLFPTRFGVLGSPDPFQYCSGAWAGAYQQGATSSAGGRGNYARFRKTVTDGTVRIGLLVSNFIDQPALTGLQLVKLEPITSDCFGDAGSLLCPCGNIGLAGRGCGNSANASGALLTYTGAQHPDTLALQVVGVPSTTFALFAQGSTPLGALPYGDGILCLGGTLTRLYIQVATGGVAGAPTVGQGSISQRSALLGDPIAPGSSRYYQVVYRDADLSFCPSPQGGTFNTTNRLTVVW